jgi:hypothetical protein
MALTAGALRTGAGSGCCAARSTFGISFHPEPAHYEGDAGGRISPDRATDGLSSTMWGRGQASSLSLRPGPAPRPSRPSM